MTDIEGSTARWEHDRHEMHSAMATHDDRIAEIVAVHHGHVVKHLGDGCWAVFASASDAAHAAVDFQHAMQLGPWDHGQRLRLRMGLHTGMVEPIDGDYFGPVPNRTARIVDLANGDQIVCSSSTAHLLDGFELRSEGRHELRGIGLEELFMVLDDRLRLDPYPLRRAIAPSNLPRTHTSFVGRAEATATIVRFVEEDHAVVTLVGPGGVGKTRLASEVGTTLRERFMAGVYFCDLAAVAEPGAIVEAVAEAVGARRQPGLDLLDSIFDYLVGRHVLLILDNCEHVLHAASEMVMRLRGIDTVRVLVTSREPLHLMGEQVVVVEPLAPNTDGADLFMQRVRERLPDFDPTAEEMFNLRELVRRLDGIPLAIELAAAWAGVMSAAALATRLAANADLLHDDHRVARHVSLRDTVSWSYELLTPSEAALFRRMSVFAGGCTLESIEAVCGGDRLVPETDVARLVLALVDKSMVVTRPDAAGRRFSLLETLRTFGHEQLDDAGTTVALRRRHADHFRDFAAQQEERIFSPAEPHAWRALDTEWANLRTAFDTFQAIGDVDAGAALVSSLAQFASLSLRFELFTWAAELLETSGIETSRSYTDICGVAALGAYFTVDPSVTELAERGLAANSLDPKGFCRTALAAVFLNNLHRVDTSDALTSAWLAASPADTGSRMWAEAFRTFHLCTHAPSPEAARHSDATERLADETGSITARALASWARGQVVALTDHRGAMDVWTEGLEWQRSLPGEHLLEPLLTGLILHFAVGHGDLVETLGRCRDALRWAVDAHYMVGASHLLGVTAIALSRADDAETGAHLVGAMIGNGHLPRPNAVRVLQGALGTRDLDAHYAPGTSWTVARAVRVALDALDTAIASTV
jgi:predicted ATPase